MLAYLDGPLADLQFRRGWTHGVLALALWPWLLTAAILLLDRAARGLTRASLPSAVRPRAVLLLAGVAILSHPILDTLNTYGMRWLMPFSGHWFYGDTLFIVDPWIWLALGLGTALSGRARGSGPARVGLALVGFYILAMAGAALAARRLAARELAELSGSPVERLMVAPVPLDPFERTVVAAQGEVYRLARFRWLARPHLDRGSVRTFPAARPAEPAIAAAVATVEGRRFLGWARFPWFQVEPAERGSVVHIVDLRYADRPGVRFGAVSIPVAQSEVTVYRKRTPSTNSAVTLPAAAR